MKIFKRAKESFISEVFIISVVFGFAAGVVGQIVSNAYLNPTPADYGLVNLNQNAISAVPELKAVRKIVGIQQDFQVNDSVNKVAPALAGIYEKKAGSGNILSQVYLPGDLLANGFVLTADGWLISYNQSLVNFSQQSLTAVVGGKVYPLETMITDQATGAIFIKVTANNLSVATLGDSNETVGGQLAIVLDAITDTAVVNIQNSNYVAFDSAAAAALVSERYNESMLLSSNIKSNYIGSPVINLNGEIIGILKDGGDQKKFASAVPINQIRPIVSNVMRTKKIQRPYLGLTYLDLAWSVGLSQSLAQGLNRGALILQNPKAKSPAAIAGLKINDIIVSIEGQQLDRNTNLTDLIQSYQPNDKVTLEIIRDGKSQNISVTLMPSQ